MISQQQGTVRTGKNEPGRMKERLKPIESLRKINGSGIGSLSPDIRWQTVVRGACEAAMKIR